ncbi:lyase family protein [Bartonella schoenbuchensis]|uniref:lyase family protein n=1 Tax=Bartonella schoenbuchensis TaxID=165694 RepID=UPI001FED958C|nr:lyase family protein [Bartonella schoenbuchensis]
MHNLIDSVSDRDFALEFLSAGALFAMHLSTFSRKDYPVVEGTISVYSFIRCFLTGASIMPQKRNLDREILMLLSLYGPNRDG